MAEGGAPWPRFLADLRERLRAAFRALDAALAMSTAEQERHPRPASGWSVREIGEHTALVDHFLLLLASKIRDKALARARRGQAPPPEPSRCEHLEKLAARDFRWQSPEHMLPTGSVDVDRVRVQLAGDLARCEQLLDEVPAGEGALHRIRMSVVGDDDRLDLYQFLCVIALHAERHVAQMRRANA